MDEEISQEESLKQKSSISLKPSQITGKSVISTIQEEEEEEESLEDDLEGTITTGDAELPEEYSDTEKDGEEVISEVELLQNPGLSQAYMLGAAKPPKHEVDEDLYLRLVKEAKIMPIKRIVNSLSSSGVHLQYYGLDCAQMKPLTESLMENMSVKELNLKSNILSLDAMYHLELMLRRNVSLSVLNLSQCKITAEGIEMLGTGLEICPQLAVLDLSYNDFGDQGVEILAEKLCYNTSITNLILSHNNLTHKSGIYLAETMVENYSLQQLDLSWNQIAEDQGLKKFLYAAAEHNESILLLDLSWNTLSGEKTANIIKTFIGQHRTLQELNLSHNRFETAAEVTKISKGINTAPNLKMVNLSYNGITADTAFALLSNISTKAKLNVLRLDNVWVKPEFEKLRRELESQIGMKVIVEGVTGGFGAKGPDMQTLLLKRAHHLGYLPKKPKNKKDFGWFLLRLQKTGNLLPVKKAKFEKLVLEDKIKFDEGMVDELAKRFKDDNKKIDLNLMLEKYLLLYPETVLPIPKEKKKKKTSKEKEKSEVESPEKPEETESPEKLDETESPEKLDETESPEKLDETESPAKHDEVEEEEREKKSKEDIREATDIPELVTKVNSRESVQSQIKVIATDESENKKKEIEGDEEIIKQEIPEIENDTQQTEDNLLEEKIELEKDLKGKEENEVEENKTEVNEENNEVNVVDDTNKEEEQNHVEEEEEEGRKRTKGWKVVRESS